MGNYFSVKRYEVLLSSCDVLFRALAHPCVHLSFILRSALTRSRADPDQLQVDPVTQVCMEFLGETWSRYRMSGAWETDIVGIQASKACTVAQTVLEDWIGEHISTLFTDVGRR